VNRSARPSLNDFFGLKNDESDANDGHALRVPLSEPGRDRPNPSRRHNQAAPPLEPDPRRLALLWRYSNG
jgi:hypothetical protein